MYYIGIDLGGTIIKIGLSQLGKIIAHKKLEADSKNGLGVRLEAIADAIDEMLAEVRVPINSIGGVFLAFPGIVDVRAKRVVSTNAKYDDAPSIDLQEWCYRHWNVPLVIDNDARAAVVGEWKFGAAKGYENVVMMTIGTGIGTGVIIGGRPLYGQHFRAGSLGGHFIIDYKGRRCTCGNIGCVEAYASSYFLPIIISENNLISEEFRIKESRLGFKRIFELSALGNADAEIIVRECMDAWSAAIVNYIHAYDPQIVILGGGVMNSKEKILPYVQSKVDALAWCPDNKVEIVSSSLGDNVALLAAEYYLNNSFFC